jgi:hypothetical protein
MPANGEIDRNPRLWHRRSAVLVGKRPDEGAADLRAHSRVSRSSDGLVPARSIWRANSSIRGCITSRSGTPSALGGEKLDELGGGGRSRQQAGRVSVPADGQPLGAHPSRHSLWKVI